MENKKNIYIKPEAILLAIYADIITTSGKDEDVSDDPRGDQGPLDPLF